MTTLVIGTNQLDRLRNPVQQAFSYGIRHDFNVIQWTVTLSSLNQNENMPYPIWKSCRTGFCNLPNIQGSQKS